MEKEITKIEELEAIGEAIRSLSRAVMSRALYPVGHPTILDSVRKAYHILANLLKEKRGLSFGLIGDGFVFGDIALPEMGEGLKGFMDHLKEREIERISFLRELKGDELERFIECLVLDPKELIDRGGLSKELSRLKISSIACGRLALPQEEKIGEDIEIVLRKDASEIYQENLGPIKELVSDIRSGRALNLDGALTVIQNLVDGVSWEKTALMPLAMLKVHDDYTFTHALNVSLLNMAQGRLLGFKENILYDLGIAGMLHDVGKEFIPGEILRKPGKLSEEEIEMVRKHPVDGAKFLRKEKKAGSLVQIVAFEHHLGYDLSGYPRLSQKRKINIASMITTISDYYDALTTIRPYRKEFLQEQALRIMLGFSGKVFESILLAHFVRAIGFYKVGDSVELDTGEIGIVHKENQDLLRPQVKIVCSKDGEKVSKVVELSEKDGRGEYLRSILSKYSLKKKEAEDNGNNGSIYSGD